MGMAQPVAVSTQAPQEIDNVLHAGLIELGQLLHYHLGAIAFVHPFEQHIIAQLVSKIKVAVAGLPQIAQCGILGVFLSSIP